MEDDLETILLHRELAKEEKRMKMEEKENLIKMREERKKQNLQDKIDYKKHKEEEKLMRQAQQEELKILKAEQKLKRQMQEKELRIIRNEKKQKRIQEQKVKAIEAAQKRKDQALKGMQYLLNISEKYSDFFKEKLEKASSGKVLQERNELEPTKATKKSVCDKSKSSEQKDINDVTKQLKYFEGGELREYQIQGVHWMNTLFDNGINGILADEMGLGKTIQVIALICHLLERQIPGPYLIVAPLSTIPNWDLEFKRFAPKVPVIVLYGNEIERREQQTLIERKQKVGNFSTHSVILTTYQMPLMEMKFINKFDWQYLIVDEGHCIKNHDTKLARILRSLSSSNRLLLTGTPIHNNITELWALLNFLMPDIFNNVDTFASLLVLEDMQDENKLLEQEERTNLLSTLHRVIEPFVLRRLKKDVLGDIVPKKEANIFCPLSKLQRDLYTFVIEKNIASLRKAKEKSSPIGKRKRKAINYHENIKIDDFSDYEDEVLEAEEILKAQNLEREEIKVLVRLTMQNPLSMFKKIVDHPYLIHFPLDPDAPKKSLLINEELVLNSGKMIILDQMLKELKKNGHKVLIFSTLVMCLDLIEEMFIMRRYKYCRLDGSVDLETRKENIESFNKDPKILAFLLSTRAGGLGLNLTGADTVIFFDRDWNPQVDIQAQDRCHRIGQTRPVMVYTLVTKNTIDEKVIEAGYKKRLLEKVVIKDGKFQKEKIIKNDPLKLESDLLELKKLLQEESSHFQDLAVPMEELDKLLDRSEMYAAMKIKNENTENTTINKRNLVRKTKG